MVIISIFASREDWDHDDEKPKIKPSPKPKQMIASKANAEVHQANLARLQAELQLQQGLWEQKCNPPLESNDLECKGTSVLAELKLHAY